MTYHHWHIYGTFGLPLQYVPQVDYAAHGKSVIILCTLVTRNVMLHWKYTEVQFLMHIFPQATAYS